MSRFTALLDACVLVPVASADTLLRLASSGLFRPLWSDQILEEVESALIRVHPDLADGRAKRRLQTMNNAFPDAKVTAWTDLAQTLALPDPGDAHVIAAAIRGRADLIVTQNLSDFPQEVLEPLGLDVQGLDEFLLNQLDLAPSTTLTVLREQAADMRRPTRSIHEVLESLGRLGAPRFAELARAQLWRLPNERGPRRALGARRE